MGHQRWVFTVMGSALALASVLFSAACSLEPGVALAEAAVKTQTGDKWTDKKFEGGRFKIRWKLDGEKFRVRLASGFTGYMGFGINSKPSMTGADLVIARMTPDGKATAEDHFCKAGKVHKQDTELGGSSRITKVSGSTKGDWTVIDIVLKAVSKDIYDISIEPGKEYYFLVSASNNSGLTAFHSFVKKFKVSF
jgi:hypothetical protein